MYRSWRFSPSAIALSVATTGIWNIFMKLALPIVALGLLALNHQARGGIVTASLSASSSSSWRSSCSR
ncbi:MAG TPA: hypothetical protein VHM47_01820 [Actinomycetota bacterium]|jgi:hypothetical protein|nr:hypothetical protein [Actinomycetota bacterium]